MKKNILYLKHILDSIERIEEYIRGVDYEDFMESSLIQAATIREIEIIGEATKNLDVKFREKYNTLPLRKMSGMGDKLIHDYFGVDLDAVWDTVTIDLPPLKDKIISILEEIELLS
ncbi:MAG: hypothetical protein AMQ74_00050 [Candidatus Methanofastidiosum methylothiophilum]|uniref:DUF86 domain-containing protein n=1 Tax=Candidatus Methanofastidiosum methylothiophilum TaxID=1705564 RepID=A0A150JBA7_9EURY|nr:MAG: hypothetical protein AMQ74_00050 [Candidatus Methanofastidiosum methylthiophilus]